MLGIEELAGLLEKYGINKVMAFQAQGVDEEGRYLFTVGMGYREGRAVSVESLLKGFERYMGSGVAAKRRATRVLVNYVRARVPADAALALQRDPKVILVDPIDDVRGMFAKKALFVVVLEMPHVECYLRMFSGGGRSEKGQPAF